MRAVGAIEAGRNLEPLLDLVERGEDVVITRDGRPVARLTSVKATHDVERARAAAARIREMSRGVTLGDVKIRDLIDEGRP